MSATASTGSGLLSKSVAEGSSFLQFLDSPETEKRFLACLRTALGVASVYHSPLVAVCTAGISLISPSTAKRICDGVDGGVTGLWNNMGVVPRVVAVVGGVAILVTGINSLPVSVVSGFFASKVGVELALKNYSERGGSLER